MMKTLVILPTYNEHENMDGIIRSVLAHGLFDILVVDDNSGDGTRDIVRSWMQREESVNMLERPSKMGLGTAYVAGFKWGLERGYECFIEMDSDFSHDPARLSAFYDEVKNTGAGLVIGSRYIGGTISVIGWDFKRLLLSRFGNFYASTILQLPLTDMTSGFRAFSREALECIDLDSVKSEGYAFQIEMAYYVWESGLVVKDLPIIFTERAEGTSKMSGGIVREAVRLPWKLRARKLFGTLKVKRASDR